MTREDVKKILPEITDEQLGGIMKLHGGDITALKAKISDMTDDIAAKEKVINLKNDKIAELEKVDVEALKKTEYERGKAEAAQEVERFKFENSLNSYLEKAGAKNVKALKALLKLDDVKLDGEKLTGLDEQLEALKKDNAFLFESEKGGKPSFSPGGTSGAGEITKETFDKMGYLARVKLYNENPELYNELSGKE